MSLFLAFVAGAALHGADQPDPRSLAFVGCWQPAPAEAFELDASAAAPEPAPMICIRPEGDGLAIATVAPGLPLRERIVRIGSGALEEGGCRGTESTQWSADGRRVLIRSELECAGGVTRSSRGVLALVSRGALVDVQAVSVGGESEVRLVRYAAVEPSEYPAGYAPDPAQALARETARLDAALPLELEAVIEAYQVVDATALEALLAARRAGWELDAATLTRLSDAGLPPSTLDVMIALSYPDEFEVYEEQELPRERVLAGGGYPWYGSSWGLSRTRFGCYGYSSYYYSPYGCDSFGWGSRRGWVYVVPVGRGDEIGSSARAVKGRGYSRGDRPSLGTARPRVRADDSGGRTPRSTLTPRTSGSDRATSGSSGGSSRGSGRKAKPRDN